MIINLTKEGCGIRSISRLLEIAVNTVISRIKSIAKRILNPTILLNQDYEMDELKTFVGNKKNEQWLIYVMEKDSRRITRCLVGKRTKKNIKTITDALLISEPNRIFTDGLNIYKSLLPSTIHKNFAHQINHIERKNLSLRTSLKRLSRKTICYSKSVLMLEACCKIYFWG
jgi:insertion element IS1 protein InsB